MGQTPKDKNVGFMRTHGEKQGWDWSAACYMDHGQQLRQMALPGASKKEPEWEKQRQLSPESRVSCVLVQPRSCENTTPFGNHGKGRFQTWKRSTTGALWTPHLLASWGHFSKLNMHINWNLQFRLTFWSSTKDENLLHWYILLLLSFLFLPYR